MKIPTLETLEKFLISKSYQNDVTHKNVKKLSEKFISFLNDRNQSASIIAESSISEMVEKFYIGSSQSSSTIKKDMGILKDFSRYTQELDNNENENTQKSEKSDTENFDKRSDLSSEEIARKQEELRASQELAEKQTIELEKTRKENLEKMRKLEEDKKEALRLQALKEAQEKKARMEKRIAERFSGFESEEIKDCFIDFNIEENIPKKAQVYFQQKEEKTIFYDIMNKGNHVVLVGQAGTGKTELALLYAYDTKTPVFKYSCSADARKNDLIGSKTINEAQMVKIVCGMITKAVLAGNKFGKSELILDEGNALIPKVQILLQGLTDGTGFIDLPEGKLKINKGVKFNVVITMNDQYSGTNPLNKPIRNRFRYIEMDRLTTETKLKIFKPYNVSEELKNKLCKFDDKMDNLQKEMRLSDEESLSVRSMKAILEDIEEFEALQRPNALQRALELNFNTKFSDKEDRQTIQKEVDLIFN